MRLYIILTEAEFSALKRNKLLFVNRRNIDDRHFLMHSWMSSQMEKRLMVQKPRKYSYPWFAWYQHQNTLNKSPDFTQPGFCKPGTTYWALVLEIPDNEVLLFNAQNFKFVERYWYFPDNLLDENWFSESLHQCNILILDHPYPEPFHSRIIQSWEKIFDLTKITEYCPSLEERKIKAAFWWLRKDYIVDGRIFTAN